LEVCNPAGCDQANGTFEVLELQVADLSIEKVDLIDPIDFGDSVTYMLTIRNNGLDNAINVVLVDAPEYSFSLITASTGCIEESGQITCSYLELAAGDEMTFVLTLQPQDEIQSYINQATIASDTGDPSLANNIDSETTNLRSVQSFYMHIPLVIND
jgi:uncharacterized repeat protein (TIGR01451 family)